MNQLELNDLKEGMRQLKQRMGLLEAKYDSVVEILNTLSMESENEETPVVPQLSEVLNRPKPPPRKTK